VRANRQSLGALLGSQGHTVFEAPNGEQGLAVVRAERPHLVITDLLMPVLNGYQFVKQLRLDPGLAAIPVVFYTAHYGEREARALAALSGVSDILTKPADPVQVLKIVEQALRGESEGGAATAPAAVTSEYDREQLRLVTHELSETVDDLRHANARLRALINIGLEFASGRSFEGRVQRFCASVGDLFAASYVAIGILDGLDGTLQRFVTCGQEATDWTRTPDAAEGLLRTVVGERRTLRGHNFDPDASTGRLPFVVPQGHAFVAAPIASPARVYGWICLVGNEELTFSLDDEQLVDALAGQIGRVYELEHEVADRQRAELAVVQERDRAQQYLDAAEVVLLGLNLDGQITLVNRYACSVLGWPQEELLGRAWSSFIPEPLRRWFEETFVSVIEGRRSSIIENPLLTRSGDERLIAWHNKLLYDPEGRPTGTLSCGIDITDRHAAVEAMRTAEERMRFALEGANVGIWDIDYRTGVLRWSETLEAHYGLEPGGFAGTFDAFRDRIHPDDRASVMSAIEAATRSGSDFSFQHRSLRPDGSVRWLNGAGRIHLGPQGEPLRGVGISLDVTERHTLEMQYRQAQKMEAVGQLAGGVAHDFNNLLSVILGNCELVRADLPAGDAGHAGIDEIQAAGESAARLTRQLLAFSRKEIVQPAVVDLNQVMTGMRTLLDRIIREDVTVVLTLAPAPVCVNADRGQLEQIVLNLAVNARDAMPTGGTLRIETGAIAVEPGHAGFDPALSPGPYATLTVTDTGAGMTPQVRAHLFEPFFTTKEMGTGLGLATVHGIVSQSGGAVRVASETGSGTTMTVYLPSVHPGKAVGQEARPPARSHTGAETVLVVEDAVPLMTLVKRLLQRQGYAVLTASNADEAFRLCDSTAAIDLVLTDVVMPGGSGSELAKRLMERRPGLKVIYMSGYTQATIDHGGVVNAGTTLLHKPFTSESLSRTVREVLDR
jgi:PAS domain S-box-containing protein